jgi:flagellar biosynthesis protein FlhG
VLKNRHDVDRFRILVNQVKEPAMAKEMFKKLHMACDHFLGGVSLDLTGVVPYDPQVRRAVINQKPFSVMFPSCPASQSLAQAAQKISAWKGTTKLDGNIKFFWKRLLFQEQSVA